MANNYPEFEIQDTSIEASTPNIIEEVKDNQPVSNVEYKPTGVPISKLQEIQSQKFGGSRDLITSILAGAGVGASSADNPASAFLTGFTAGMQIPSKLRQQREQEIQSQIDVLPFEEVSPELASRYNLQGIPTKLAYQTIQKIKQDVAPMQELGKGIIPPVEDKDGKPTGVAVNFATLINKTGFKDANIQPEDLVGMRVDDVQQMLKMAIEDSYKSGMITLKEASQLRINNPQALYEEADTDLANNFGIPAKRKNPYFGMNESVLNKVKTASVRDADKEVEKLETLLSSSSEANVSLDRAEALLDLGLNTGPIVGVSTTVRKWTSKDAQEFNQIAEKLLPSMRQGMPGQVSDRDIQMFRNANIALDKDEDVNRNVIQRARAINERIQDKAQFLTNWINVYGDTKGAQAAWNGYINTYNLFDNNGNVIPQDTYPSWRDYMLNEYNVEGVQATRRDTENTDKQPNTSNVQQRGSIYTNNEKGNARAY